MTYFVDNQPAGKDVFRFVDGKVDCDGCRDLGHRPGMFQCKQVGPDSLEILERMTKDQQLARRLAFTLTEEGIDGKMDIKGEDGKFTIQTFSGHPER